jgi:hypothetical protein
MRELRERYPRPEAQLAPSSAGPVLLATRTQADTALTRPNYRPPGHQPCRPQGRRHRRPPPTLQRPRRHPSAGLYWASQAREPDSPALCRGPGARTGDLILIRILPGDLFPQDRTRDLRDDVALETVANRSAPMACGPNVDQARPARGGNDAPPRRRLCGYAAAPRLNTVEAYGGSLLRLPQPSEVMRSRTAAPTCAGGTNLLRTWVGTASGSCTMARKRCSTPT